MEPLNFTHHDLLHIRTTLLELRGEITQIKDKLTMAQATLDDLKAKVDAEATVEQSAMILLSGLSAQLAAAKNDPAKIQAIADELDANKAALTASITANTPA